jgi:hypothetical protein
MGQRRQAEKDERRKTRKRCFFEKKQQKTFESSRLRARHQHSPSVNNNFFAELFFKKATAYLFQRS